MSPEQASGADRLVPAELDRIVTRALAPVPVDRFPTAGAFATALRAGEPWTARAGARQDASRGAASSIAVLPFANLSPSPDNEYFADG